MVKKTTEEDKYRLSTAQVQEMIFLMSEDYMTMNEIMSNMDSNIVHHSEKIIFFLRWRMVQLNHCIQNSPIIRSKNTD